MRFRMQGYDDRGRLVPFRVGDSEEWVKRYDFTEGEAVTVHTPPEAGMRVAWRWDRLKD